MSESIPTPIRRAKSLVNALLETTGSLVDRSTDHVMHDLLGWVREDSEAATIHARGTIDVRKADGPESGAAVVTPSRFADPEEIGWLESGRSELPYRRDKLWAVPQMWNEMALGSIGAATYIAACAAANPVGMTAGWALASGGKGLLLLADLGRPERFPRVFAKPGTSWIARGSWAFATFATAGAASLLPGPCQSAAKAVAGTSAAVLITYDGFFLNRAKAVASWLPRSLPWMLAAGATTAGAALASALGDGKSATLPVATVASAACGIGCTAGYLTELSRGNTAARLSARDLVEGPQRDRFLGTGIVLGAIAPAVLSSLGAGSARSRTWSAAAACVGVVAVRRAVLQSGIHAPVIDPPRTSQSVDA